MNGGKSSAESHASHEAPGEDACTYNTKNELTGGAAEDKEVEEVTDMFADLAKKVRPQR